MAIVIACAVIALGDVVIETVTVGNLGNVGEWSGESHGGLGPDRICGAVDYRYSIAKYEVTAGQYCEFLNAVAVTDTYDLYNPEMWTTIGGCRIQRIGDPGSYSYSVPSDWSERPVTSISWGDAVRFCNWLHNGQPTGPQGPDTTEDGSYFIDGAVSDAELNNVARNPNANWVIPSADEWYKAAFHQNDGPTGNYFDYPTATNVVPSNDLVDPDPGNNANYFRHPDDFTIGPPYFRTEVGEFEYTTSPYGAFDMGGNAQEWTEEIIGTYRGTVGGSSNQGPDYLFAAHRDSTYPSNDHLGVGLRLVLLGPTGACCLPHGGCMIENEDACAAVGGAYQGDNTDCAVYPCPAINVQLEVAVIGNAGNPPDTRYVASGRGGVSYPYEIGTYEITAGQYCKFLNAVAKADTYGLYNLAMWASEFGCKIHRTGSTGTYVYTVGNDWADRPVNYVGWGDAARFCNWLHNGQPVGPQATATTESGSYFLDGATSNGELLAVARRTSATWVIPTEDEWYKAAFHKNDGATANYFDYPTSSDEPPSNLLDGSGNNATYHHLGYTIGSPYYRTIVGAHFNSESPYGTFDQGGNVWEWTEAVQGAHRMVHRGSFDDRYVSALHAAGSLGYDPVFEYLTIGLRVARVAPTLGDLNCDGFVTAADIDPFVIALTGGQAEYESQFPNCNFYNADCNQDGGVGAADIDPFVAILIGR
jgi:formylglycine-generating enzyme required for sulfatase activity